MPVWTYAVISTKFSIDVYLWMPQIRSFIFEDHRPDFVNDYVGRNKFQVLNFLDMQVILANSKIYDPQKFVQVWCDLLIRRVF